MKNLKKTLKASTAALLTLSMTACSSGTSSADSSASAVKTGTTSTYAYLLDTTDLPMADLDLSDAEGVLAEILEEGVLTIATSPDYPAAEFVDEDGTVWGSEMMLAKYIADNLGVDLDIETMDFNATLTAVSTGKVDMAISGFGWKADRAESYELSIGYQGTSEAACHTLLVYTDTQDEYETLDDFSDKTIIAQSGSLQQMYVEDQIPDATLELVTSLDQAILSLAANKVDAVALDCTTAGQYADQSDGQFAVSSVEFDLSQYSDYEGNVAACAKGETDLIEAVNEIIQVVLDNELYQDWWTTAKAQAGIED